MARVISLAIATLLLVGCAHKEAAPPPAATTKPARHSTAEERQRFLTLVHRIQASPPRGYDAEVEWGIVWLVEVDDVTVTLCADTLGTVLREREEIAFNPAIISLLSAGAFVIEHPDRGNDNGEVNYAAIMAVLDVYAGERKRGAPASPALEELAARARAGTLRAQFMEQVRRCKK